MAGFFFDEPAIRGADASGSSGFAFEQESGTVAHLGDGCVDAEVPNGSSDEIVALLEVGGEIEPFVAPVGKIAASGSVTDSLSIHIQDEAIVGAYADDVGGGD